MEFICRPYITFKNKKVIYARNYGKKSFCFWVKNKKDQALA